MCPIRSRTLKQFVRQLSSKLSYCIKIMNVKTVDTGGIVKRLIRRRVAMGIVVPMFK